MQRHTAGDTRPMKIETKLGLEKLEMQTSKVIRLSELERRPYIKPHFITKKGEPESIIEVCYQIIKLCQKFRQIKLTKEISGFLDDFIKRYKHLIDNAYDIPGFTKIARPAWRELASIEKKYYYQKRQIPTILADL